MFQDFLGRFRPLVRDELLAVYATGGAAEGDYVSGSSDIDGLVVLRDGWRDRCPMSDVSAQWAQLETDYSGVALQLQFSTIEEARETLPLVDIESWHRAGLLVYGDDVRYQVPRPTLEMVRLDMLLLFLGRYGGCLGKTLPYRWSPREHVGTFVRHPAMVALWITYPARFLYTWHFGKAAGKAAAVCWHATQWPGPTSCWMQQVIEWRAKGFPEREKMVLAWGRKVPDLTRRFAMCLKALLSGAEEGLDSQPSGGTLEATMRILARRAGWWLDRVPGLERRRGNLLWAGD